MFEVNEYVFYGSEGICRIDDIVSSPFSDVKTDAKYYVLHSTHGGNSTAYVPLEGAGNLLRPVMTKNDIDMLMSKVAGITLFEECNLKQLKEKYSTALRSGDPCEWVRVIRTVTNRIVNGRDGGKKVSDAERSFSDNAKKFLYKEIATVLGIDENGVPEYIEKCCGETL
ncbi:MAG: CarD family transcriptional regulator [Clostridia bacterium]|nr:CarD family transcriptional regulator [Clostridia bacterium]